jgi:hypothetical protein
VIRFSGKNSRGDYTPAFRLRDARERDAILLPYSRISLPARRVTRVTARAGEVNESHARRHYCPPGRMPVS